MTKDVTFQHIGSSVLPLTSNGRRSALVENQAIPILAFFLDLDTGLCVNFGIASNMH